MRIQCRGAKSGFHGAADASLDLLGFATEHGGLVRHANGIEVLIGIEARGIGTFEPFEKLGLVPPLDDVVADVVGFVQVVNHEIMTGAEGGGLGSRGLGLLMLGFAVDDAGHRFTRILPDPFPDAHHITARGVDQQAALGFEFLPGLNLGSKRRNDHHIVRFQLIHLGRTRLGGNRHDSHVADLVVDLRVVDDLAKQVNGARWREDAARGVSQVDRAFNAVTKAEFLGQLHREPSGSGQDAAIDANARDQLAPVMGDDLGLNGLHNVRSSEVDFLWRRGRVG